MVIVYLKHYAGFLLYKHVADGYMCLVAVATLSLVVCVLSHRLSSHSLHVEGENCWSVSSWQDILASINIQNLMVISDELSHLCQFNKSICLKGSFAELFRSPHKKNKSEKNIR